MKKEFRVWVTVEEENPKTGEYKTIYECVSPLILTTDKKLALEAAQQIENDFGAN